MIVEISKNLILFYLIHLRFPGSKPVDEVLCHLGEVLLVGQHQNFGAFFL